ncbi:protein UL34 [Cynomolgus macaque cytomegalovirus strain Ottawa]|uniref:Protein UL34 n=1 Tax=macacine betaherpesvirus 8 TaxID=2560567 RepID=G8H157_9BETA|nr:protein UL34 [Cynomolgus macaque cytomegalovirus strain Ottawa]AEQ32131.1 protein UL34 [Cynomolgus macaque cytomegalovirus strain Ottawa]
MTMNIIITTRDFSNDESVVETAELHNSVANSISKAYRGTIRAEGKKKLLIRNLPAAPGCTRRNSNLFIFCHDRDYRKFHQGIVQLKRTRSQVDPSDIVNVTKNIKCRLQPHNQDPPLFAGQLQNTIAHVCTLFNQLVFTAQLRHYCENHERVVLYARDELTRRCGDKSTLGIHIYQLISLLDQDRHSELCHVLVGLLHQTPHMWARSIRLMGRLRNYLQQRFLHILVESGLQVDSIFESCYHSEAYRLLFQIDKTNQTPRSLTYSANVMPVIENETEATPVPPCI